MTTKLQPIKHLFSLLWNTVPLYGVPTQPNQITSWKWCKEGQPDILQIDIITPAASRTCYKIFNGRETLEPRRMKIHLIMLFKIINDLIDNSAEEYLTPASTRTRALHSKKLRQYPTKMDSFKFNFFPRTIPAWNSLPATIAEALTWYTYILIKC